MPVLIPRNNPGVPHLSTPHLVGRGYLPLGPFALVTYYLQGGTRTATLQVVQQMWLVGKLGEGPSSVLGKPWKQAEACWDGINSSTDLECSLQACECPVGCGCFQ